MATKEALPAVQEAEARQLAEAIARAAAQTAVKVRPALDAATALGSVRTCSSSPAVQRRWVA